MKPNNVLNLTYLGVTDLAFASSAPPKTQVKTALEGRSAREISEWPCQVNTLLLH